MAQAINDLRPQHEKLEALQMKLKYAKNDDEKSALLNGYHKKDISKPPYKIFISSPSDVDFLRDAAEEIVSEFNDRCKRLSKPLSFETYRWEDRVPLGDHENIQKTIDSDYGSICHIFLLILWKKIGSGGTEAEYERYKSEFKLNNPNILPIFCWYAEPISLHSTADIAPQDLDFEALENIVKLNSFYTKNAKNWIELGRKRKSITSKQIFEKKLRDALQEYLNKQS